MNNSILVLSHDACFFVILISNNPKFVSCCNRSSLKKMRPFSLHAAINYCGFRWRVFFLFSIIILKFCNVWLILNNHLEIVPCEWTVMFQFHVNSRKYLSFVQMDPLQCIYQTMMKGRVSANQKIVKELICKGMKKFDVESLISWIESLQRSVISFSHPKAPISASPTKSRPCCD